MYLTIICFHELDENIKIKVIKIILIYKPGNNELPQAHRE